jgi:hypothetical protein
VAPQPPTRHDLPTHAGARKERGREVKRHTPGPWGRAATNSFHTVIYAEGNGRIAIVEDHNQDAGIVTQEANAALISSAPDLLEALEECDRVFSKFQPDPMSAYGMAWGDVQTAIARAKGGPK